MDKRLRGALRAVTEATAAILESATDHDRLLDTAARVIARAIPDTCLVSLRSEETATVTIVAAHDEDAQVRESFAALKHRPRALHRIATSALESGAQLIPTIDYEGVGATFAPDAVVVMKRFGVRSMIVAALRWRDETFGVLTLLRHRAELDPFDDVDRELAEHLAATVALALVNERLERKQQRLASEAEAMRFVDAILENIPDMVFVKEADELRFVRFNRAGEELLGMRSADLLGKNDFDFFPRAEAEFFVNKDRETLAAKTLVDIPEEPIHTANGKRWLHTKKVPIIDQHGVPRFLLGISEDITERKKVFEELHTAKEKAEAANRELESFSYSVAHDLRAPLRAIDGFAQALLEDYATKLDIVGHRHLERIRAASQRMATLIDDLLRLSRVSRAEHNPGNVNLASLARIAVGQLERAEPNRKVHIAIPKEIEVKADAKLLAIALDNLLGNAWKFTAKTPDAEIDVGVKREDGKRVFFVRDNGAGFDMAYANKLFGVFQRLHPMHEFPGTGIGLATVKRVVERHGGRIWAESEVGKGATFYFTLGDDA